MGRNVRYIGPFEAVGASIRWLFTTRAGRITGLALLALVFLLTCIMLFVARPSNLAGTVTPTSYLLSPSVAYML